MPAESLVIRLIDAWTIRVRDPFGMRILLNNNLEAIVNSVLFCAAFVLVGLLAVGIAYDARLRWPWKLTLVSAFLFPLSFLWPGDLTLLFFVQIAVVMLPISVVSRWKLRRVEADNNHPMRRGWFRLRLSEVLALVGTASLTMVSAMQWGGGWHVLQMVAVGSCTGVVTLCAVWLAWGRRWVLLRAGVTAVTCAGVGWGLAKAYYGFSPIAPWSSYTDLLWIDTFVCGGALLAVLLGLAGFARRNATRESSRRNRLTQRFIRGGVNFLIAFSIAGLALPLIAVYLRLVRPMPTPATVLGDPEGRAMIIEAADESLRFPPLSTDSYLALDTFDPLTPSVLYEYRSHAEMWEPALSRALGVLERPQLIAPVAPVEEPLRGHAHQVVDLMRAIWAKIRVLEQEEKSEEALRLALALCRIDGRLSQGGRQHSVAFGRLFSGVGKLNVARMRDNIHPDSRIATIRTLNQLEGEMESIPTLAGRELASQFNETGWRGRLSITIRSCVAIDPVIDVQSSFASYELWRRAEYRILYTYLAVDAYAAEHGVPPTRLADLVPEYLDAVPVDPFGMGTLKYLVRDDDIVVYSLGRDGVDNGEEIFETPRGERDILYLGLQR